MSIQPSNFFSRMVASAELCAACDLLKKIKDEPKEALENAADRASISLKENLSAMSGATVVPVHSVDNDQLRRLGIDPNRLKPAYDTVESIVHNRYPKVRLEGVDHLAYLFGIPLKHMLCPATLRPIFEK